MGRSFQFFERIDRARWDKASRIKITEIGQAKKTLFTKQWSPVQPAVAQPPVGRSFQFFGRIDRACRDEASRIKITEIGQANKKLFTNLHKTHSHEHYFCIPQLIYFRFYTHINVPNCHDILKNQQNRIIDGRVLVEKHSSVIWSICNKLHQNYARHHVYHVINILN